MKNLFITAVATTLLATSAFAHYDTSGALPVWSVDEPSPGYVEVIIDTNHTEVGSYIHCVVFEDAGRPILTEGVYSQAIATTLFVRVRKAITGELSATCVVGD